MAANVAVIGPPGAGKGTHAKKIVDKFDLTYVSTGALLRENLEQRSGLGFMAQGYMDQREVVPRTVVDAMVVDFLSKVKPETGLLFNGFPRTIYQAQYLDDVFEQMGRSLDAVIYLRTSDQEIVCRLSGRMICDKCQAPFHQTSNPFQTCPYNRCQGEHLYRPKDDTPDMIQMRLQAYRRATVPLLEYYQETDRLVIIDGEGEIEAIDNALFETVEAVRKHQARRATRDEVAQIGALKQAEVILPQQEMVHPSLDVVFLGAPGAGKGTQAAYVSRVFNIPRIATGDLFRENIRNETELGLMAKSYMDHGKLVPDEVTEAMVRERLSRTDVKDGFILDGFPRNLPQAESLSVILAEMNRRLDSVIYLKVADDEIIKRLSGRLICQTCHHSFHETFNPFQTCPHNQCRGEYLYPRNDDAPDTVKSRLKTFHGETEPLVDYYREAGLLVEINGVGNLSHIRGKTLDAVKLHRN
jgi:adenylate kinase